MSFISDSRLKGLSIRNLRIIDSTTIRLCSDILKGVGRNPLDGFKRNKDAGLLRANSPIVDGGNQEDFRYQKVVFQYDYRNSVTLDELCEHY